MMAMRPLVQRAMVGAGLITFASGCSLLSEEPYELVCTGKKTGSSKSSGLFTRVNPVDEDIETRFRIYPDESRVMYMHDAENWEECKGSCNTSFPGNAVELDFDYTIGASFYGREITQINLETMQFRQTDENGFDDGMATIDRRTETNGTCSRKPIDSTE